MKNTQRVLLTFLLMVSGCGGCQNETASTPPPQAAVPQNAQPATSTGQAAAPGDQNVDEDDCIVIIDVEPDYGPPPLTVEFSSEVECTKGQPTYKWDFGDGTGSEEANPKHTYKEAGDFTAKVTVTAGSATAEDEIDILVEEDEEAEAP